MGITIGNQQGGVVNNVAGDQHISGGQHGAVGADLDDARGALKQLRREIDRAALPPASNGEAQAQLEAAGRELAHPEPDRQAVAARLTRLAQVLSSVGALASAGTALGGPLVTLAGWLGALGAPILRLLAG